MHETKDEECSVTDNLVINAPSYLNYLIDENFLNNIDATYERSCMATLQGKWNMELLRYGRACMLEKKEKYYTEISDTSTSFNDNNKSPLSNVKIQEAILKVIREDKG